MEEKRGANLKAKAKGSTAPAEAKGNPKRKASGGPTGRVPKKGRSEKFCQRCKAHGGPFTRHNTLDCRRYLCRPNIWSAKFYFIYSYVNVYLTCI